jgi:hypothetical protein
MNDERKSARDRNGKSRENFSDDDDDDGGGERVRKR